MTRPGRADGRYGCIACPENDKGVVEALVEKLIDEGCTAPVRYRL